MFNESVLRDCRGHLNLQAGRPRGKNLCGTCSNLPELSEGPLDSPEECVYGAPQEGPDGGISHACQGGGSLW